MYDVDLTYFQPNLLFLLRSEPPLGCITLTGHALLPLLFAFDSVWLKPCMPA